MSIPMTVSFVNGFIECDNGVSGSCFAEKYLLNYGLELLKLRVQALWCWKHDTQRD